MKGGFKEPIRPLKKILSTRDNGTCQIAVEKSFQHDNLHDSSIPTKYEDYPLLYSMIQYESTRKLAFKCDGYDQFKYPQGDAGWWQTLFIIRGRALHQIIYPWLFVSIHAVVIVCLMQYGFFDEERLKEATGDWTMFYSFVFNLALSLLLVFRLNRAASRYWLARQFWGRLIAVGRNLTSGVLNHGTHNPELRDECVRWIAAVAVCVMAFIRGDHAIPPHSLEGILSQDTITLLEGAQHMPIYASDMLRDSLKNLFMVTADTPTSLAYAWTTQLDRLEGELNVYTTQYGAMERIRATPLPIVYVSHLRTFLIIHLLMFPYVFGPHQGWATIPLTIVTAFAFLGIEGASVEVENPFKKDHVNNLNMDALASALLQNIQQQLQCKADLEISRKYHTTRYDDTDIDV